MAANRVNIYSIKVKPKHTPEQFDLLIQWIMVDMKNCPRQITLLDHYSYGHYDELVIEGTKKDIYKLAHGLPESVHTYKVY
jgi:hypothetical protein